MIRKGIIISLLLLGCSLLTINIYGLFKNMRSPIFFNDELRFKDDQPLPYNETMAALEKTHNESNKDYSIRVTKVVAKGIAHIRWEAFEPERFNQIVPIWENYFLYFMGKFSGIPEYQKYHFVNYKKSIKRGIGICGDTSMILSQILTKNGIKNKILTFPGHVVVSATFSNGNEALLDADFGVSNLILKKDLKAQSSEVARKYVVAGYSATDEKFFENMYQQNFKEWNGVQHFITKKYYFEKVVYALKWPFPIILILGSLFSLKRKHAYTLGSGSSFPQSFKR